MCGTILVRAHPNLPARALVEHPQGKRCTYFCVAFPFVRLEAVADRVRCKASSERRTALPAPVVLLLRGLETDEMFVVRHVEKDVAGRGWVVVVAKT